MAIIPITLPLLAENGLRFLFSFVDMFMLSGLVINGTSYGDDAVAAVGLCGTFVFFINIMFRMVNSGSGIVIGQYNGARQPQKALRAVMTSILFSAALGVLLSIALALLSRPIISIYRLNEIRDTFAGDYLTIYGSFCSESTQIMRASFTSFSLALCQQCAWALSVGVRQLVWQSAYRHSSRPWPVLPVMFI